MLVNKKYLKEELETRIIPEYLSFLKSNNGGWLEQNILRGELYTKMRRYLSCLTKPSNYNIQLNHIDRIGVDANNNLVSISFINKGYGLTDKTKEMINLLNEVLSEIKVDHVDVGYQHDVNKIIESINFKSV